MDTEMTEEEITKTRKLSNDMKRPPHLTKCEYQNNPCTPTTGYCRPCFMNMKRKE